MGEEVEYAYGYGDARFVRFAQIGCVFACHSPWADARAVRPYIPISVGLMCKMGDGASCANTCRDARSVRPFKRLCTLKINRLHSLF